MQGEASNDADISFANVSTETYDNNQPDEKNSEDQNNEYINIFYNKIKNKKKNNKSLSQLKTNKFIYKGTLYEYEKVFLNKKTKIKETSYEDYVSNCVK